MTDVGEQAAWGAVGAVAVLAYVWLVAHASTRGTPASIVRRLAKSGRPLTFTVGPGTPWAWDPTRAVGVGGLYRPGTVTYSLEDDGATIRFRYAPRSGPAVERSCPVPAEIRWNTAVARRHRIARLVVATYAAVGVASFALTVAVANGSDDVRIRIGALTSLAAVSTLWLVLHLALVIRQQRTASVEAGHPFHAHLHRVALWIAGYVVVTTALALAWRFSNADQAHPITWAGAFLSAAIFVLATAAALAASLHHHTYIHHHHGGG